MIVVGLTGSIGMGKSTTSAMFGAEGIPIHDADAAVHRLYAGRAAPLIEMAFPGVTADDGAVDRDKLAQAVLGNPDALKRLEMIVHPLVREEESHFLARARASGANIVVLDIPLLFETGRDKDVDAVVVVTADAETQRQRVLARPGMTLQKLEAILDRQVPDEEKRRRADFIVDTGNGLDAARQQVRDILSKLASRRP